VTEELSNIQALSSGDPITVNLKDSTDFKQKVFSTEAGTVADLRGNLEATDSTTASMFS